MTPFPLDAALQIVKRHIPVTNDSSSEVVFDEVDAHLRVVRILEIADRLGMPIAPERLVPILAVTLPIEPHIIDVMIVAVQACEPLATALSAFNAPTSTALDRVLTLKRLLLDPALAMGVYLTPAVVGSNDFRKEELLRRWAHFAGMLIERNVPTNRQESQLESSQALARLDYRRIMLDEEKLRIEQRVLAEHAERIRERQRKRDEEALASAQRE